MDCKQVQVLPCNANQVHEEEGAQPWEAGKPGFRPVPHSLVCDKTQPLETSISGCIEWDSRASQGFLEGKGEIKEVLTHMNVLLEAQSIKTKAKIWHILPLLCPGPQADIANRVSIFSLSYIDTSKSHMYCRKPGQQARAAK